MIIARGTDGPKDMLILGLSAENVKRLTAGRPIVLNTSTHPGIPGGWTIVIAYGETEDAIRKEMEPAIGPETKIYRDPRL